MVKKNINAQLVKNDNKEIVIRFEFSDGNYDLNLQSDNSEEIKCVFLELAKQLREFQLKVQFSIDTSIDSSTDNLFIETAQEYIEQLNDELIEIENDADLKCIRKFFEE